MWYDTKREIKRNKRYIINVCTSLSFYFTHDEILYLQTDYSISIWFNISFIKN